MRALVDAEVYLYRAAAGSEYEVEFSPDSWTYMCSTSEAKTIFEGEINRVRDTMPDHDIHLVFGDSTNFRYGVYRNYKSNRRKYRRPAGYKALKEWATATWPSTKLANVEGDDVLGILCQEGDVIVSRDKDLKTIAGLHLTADGVIEISPWQADLAFYGQALTGDASDGYPGCPKVGPVAAGKLLADCKSEKELWAAVVAAYGKASLGPEVALQMARCARILRPGEYDHGKQLPILWEPPVRTKLVKSFMHPQGE
jgi:DNA polymerase-1